MVMPPQLIVRLCNCSNSTIDIPQRIFHVLAIGPRTLQRNQRRYHRQTIFDPVARLSGQQFLMIDCQLKASLSSLSLDCHPYKVRKSDQKR